MRSCSTTATGTAAWPTLPIRLLPGSRSGSCAATRRLVATSRMPSSRRSRPGSAPGRIHTVTGGPHSPQRTHPVETTAAILARTRGGLTGVSRRGGAPRRPGRSASRRIRPCRPAPQAGWSGSRSPAGTHPRSAAPSPSPNRSRRPCRAACELGPRRPVACEREPASPGRRPTGARRPWRARTRSRFPAPGCIVSSMTVSARPPVRCTIGGVP